MGKVTYADGIAILQLVIFPFILAASLYVWKQTGWRAGGKIWRFPLILSLLRIAGSISTLISISHDSKNVEIAVAVCEMIGIAPLTLTYIGLLRQVDREERLPPQPMKLIPLACLVGLIIAIIGVNDSDFSDYTPSKLMKAAMGIFLAVFALTILLTGWLFYQYSFALRNFQKQLFLGIALSSPFYTVRLIYAAISDFSTLKTFSFEGGSETAYLCMSVLEEIIAMVITIIFGTLAVREPDFALVPGVEDAEKKPIGV